MSERRRRGRGESGFTLIEMLVVLAILGVLAGVVVTAVGNSSKNAHISSCKAERASVITAFGASRASNEVEDVAPTNYRAYLDSTPGYFVLPAPDTPTSGGVLREGSTLAEVDAVACPHIGPSAIPDGSV